MTITATAPPTPPCPVVPPGSAGCPACNRLAVISHRMRCNAHRTESISTGVIRKARAAGYTGSDPLEAERFIGARPVQVTR